MKNTLLAGLVSFSLLFPVGRAIGEEKSAVAAELQLLVSRIQAKLDQGKNSKADLAPEIRGFEALLEKHKDQRTDDLADVLWTEARLYLQVLDDSDKSRELALRLKQDFPNSKPGRGANSLLASITAHEVAKRIHGGFITGGQLPGFDEKDVARKPLSLASYQGRVVLLDFWAIWSKPCMAQLPNVLDIYNKYHARGFEIIGISLDPDEMRLTAFTAQNGIPWQQFFDGKVWKTKLAVQYGITTIPANYLLDRDGKIAGKNLHGPALEREVARLLAQK
ncbi:MAG TPA: TlpA disulfide reductase family protein [Candidatus Limnocylindrales bacterium]|nr:TlpA disulfide reductase family protein [Candidatus Limnocylindrales bacterium]